MADSLVTTNTIHTFRLNVRLSVAARVWFLAALAIVSTLKKRNSSLFWIIVGINWILMLIPLCTQTCWNKGNQIKYYLKDMLLAAMNILAFVHKLSEVEKHLKWRYFYSCMVRNFK